jgi:hypothetical protein
MAKKKECTHENCEYTTQLDDPKIVKLEKELWVVLKGKNLLKRTCQDCGAETDEVVCGGILFNPEIA